MHTMIMSILSTFKTKMFTHDVSTKKGKKEKRKAIPYPAKSIKKPETQGRNTLLDTRITRKRETLS